MKATIIKSILFIGLLGIWFNASAEEYFVEPESIETEQEFIEEFELIEVESNNSGYIYLPEEYYEYQNPSYSEEFNENIETIEVESNYSGYNYLPEGYYEYQYPSYSEEFNEPESFEIIEIEPFGRQNEYVPDEEYEYIIEENYEYEPEENYEPEKRQWWEK